jgi:hypothetical protein
MVNVATTHRITGGNHRQTLLAFPSGSNPSSSSHSPHLHPVPPLPRHCEETQAVSLTPLAVPLHKHRDVPCHSLCGLNGDVVGEMAITRWCNPGHPHAWFAFHPLPSALTASMRDPPPSQAGDLHMTGWVEPAWTIAGWWMPSRNIPGCIREAGEEDRRCSPPIGAVELARSNCVAKRSDDDSIPPPTSTASASTTIEWVCCHLCVDVQAESARNAMGNPHSPHPPSHPPSPAANRVTPHPVDTNPAEWIDPVVQHTDDLPSHACTAPLPSQPPCR